MSVGKYPSILDQYQMALYKANEEIKLLKERQEHSIPGPGDPFGIRFNTPPWVEEGWNDDRTTIFYAFQSAFLDRDPKVEFDMIMEPTDVFTAFFDALYSNPLFFSVRGISSVRYKGGRTVITLDYDSKERYEELKGQIREKVVQIYYAAEIYRCTTQLEIEIAVNDWLTSNCVWKKEGDPRRYHSVLGVLLDGQGVCSSFALATSLLLNTFGVECHYVLGRVKDTNDIPKDRYFSLSDMIREMYDPAFKMPPDSLKEYEDSELRRSRYGGNYMAGGPNHAWNYVKIDGRWRHLDVTFNRGGDVHPWVRAKHRYLNLTTEEIEGERAIYFGPGTTVPMVTSEGELVI